MADALRVLLQPSGERMAGDPFALWVFGDAHVGTDLVRANRSSLADALRTSERGGDRGGPPFH